MQTKSDRVPPARAARHYGDYETPDGWDLAAHHERLFTVLSTVASTAFSTGPVGKHGDAHARLERCKRVRLN